MKTSDTVLGFGFFLPVLNQLFDCVSFDKVKTRTGQICWIMNSKSS